MIRRVTLYGMSEFIGWPNEGIEYWDAHWRGQAAEGFFDGMDATYDYDCAGCGHPMHDDICTAPVLTDHFEGTNHDGVVPCGHV